MILPGCATTKQKMHQQIAAIIQTEHLRIQRNIESIEEFEDELEEIF